jgi:diguanylate cyclase (GGDEF)-like protein
VKTTKTRTKKSAHDRGSRGKTTRAKLALVERLQSLGLLEQSSVERLEKMAETVEAKAAQGPANDASFDRELYASLVAFEAQGGDGATKRSLQPLMAYAEGLSGVSESRDGLAQALAGLRKVVAFHGASLYVRDPDLQQLDLTAVSGFEVELVPRIRFSEGTGFSSWVASRKKPVLYSSIHRNEAPSSEHVRSFMSVPLVVGGDAVGVLNLGHRDDGAYTPAELRRLLLAGGMLAGLVQRYVSSRQIQAREIRNPGTGLATPHYFRSRLEEEVIRCRELGHAMSLLLLRLNELQSLAEQFGEEFRERAGQELAGLVGAWRQPTELVGHADAGSLIAILPGTRDDRAHARAAELQVLVQKHNFPRRKKMTLGWGVATYPADAENPQELLACVDKALKEAARPRAEFEGVPQSMVL